MIMANLLENIAKKEKVRGFNEKNFIKGPVHLFNAILNTFEDNFKNDFHQILTGEMKKYSDPYEKDIALYKNLVGIYQKIT